MSQANVEIVRRGYEHFKVTGELRPGIVHPDFAWDMSMFRGWPERQTHPGIEGAMQFLADWTESWEEWPRRGPRETHRRVQIPGSFFSIA